MNTDRLKGIQWIPFVFLFFGLILRWIHIDEQGILLNIGFICYGLVMLVDGIKGKYYKYLTTETLKIFLPIVVILLAVDNLLTGDPNYTILGVVMILSYIITKGQRFAFKRQN